MMKIEELPETLIR